MKPEFIVLHHSLTKDSGTVSWSAIRRYHVQEKHWLEIGYHFGIELVGDRHEILMGRMPGETGAHCIGINQSSIGICMVGAFDLEPPSLPQVIQCRILCRWLMGAYDIPRVNVIGHREWVKDGRTCPGKAWDLAAFRKSL